MPATSDTAGPAAQWNALVDEHLTRWPPLVGKATFVEHSAQRNPLTRALHRAGMDRRPIPLWPYTQIRHARSLLRLVCDDDQLTPVPPMLREYARGSAFAERPTSDRRFVDDNAWVALAQWQERCITAPHAATSDRTEQLLRWLAEHVDDDGGARWVEGGRSRHACSTGGVGAALALIPRGDLPEPASDGPAANAEPAVDTARRCADFMREVLADESGLVRDNIDEHGVIEPTLWSYNQGLQVRLEVALHRAGDPEALARAERSASAGLSYFDRDQLWRQPVVFNAIWFRGLVAFAAASPDSPASSSGLSALAEYAARLEEWVSTHPPLRRGVVEADGPGRYESGDSGVLDRAGSVQVACLARVTPEQRLLVV